MASKEYYQKNKDKIKAKSRVYHQKNKDRINARRRSPEIALKRKLYNREYLKRPKVIKQRRAYFKKYNKTKKRKEYKKAKYRNDLNYRLSALIRKSIWVSLRGRKNGQPWEKLIGYSADDLRLHIESKFEPGMNWDNQGEWHIDHKVPISWYSFESYEDCGFKKAWALNNLQPKWAGENQAKGNRFSG